MSEASAPGRASATGRARGMNLGRAAGALSAVFVLTGSALFVAGGPATAEDTLFAYQIDAAARGFRFTEEFSGQGAGSVPEAMTSLSTGPAGYGLASMAWPGAAGANLGSLIIGLNPSAPPELQALNYPVRAEARTGQDPPTTTNTDYPGATMTATAENELVEASAHVQPTATPAGAVGAVATRAKSVLDGATAVAESAGQVEDVSLAAGVVSFKSVASEATARTDGRKGEATGRTTVTGLTLAGVPATVDDQGIHVGGQGGSPNDPLNQVGQALSQAGVTVAVFQPITSAQGSAAAYTAASLVVRWAPPGAPGAMTFAFGGASASVDGALDPGQLVDDLEDLGAVEDFDSGSPDPGAFVLGDSTPVDLPLAPVGSPAPPAAPPAAAPSVSLAPVAALSEGLSVPLVLVALGGAGLLALALRRLSDGVLAAGAEGGTCPLDRL